MADSDHMIAADGHRLRARWFAPRMLPEQPVIVLLHQGLGSITQWRGFPAALASATGMGVVGYDRWGHGASEPVPLPRPPDFLEREAERALPEVLDALGIGEAILYGHSDGGSIALLAAAIHPSRVRAVVSEAAHVYSETGSKPGFAALLTEFEKGKLRAALERHHGANTDSMFRGWFEVWSSPAMQRWTMVDRLPAVRCPVLVIQGSGDEHGSPEQVEATVRGVSGPVEALVLPGVGHAPHLEAPEVVVARVAGFLARARGATGPDGS